MLRYLYPLLMLGLLMLMCGCVPINLAENGWVMTLLAMVGGLVLTAIWPFWIGNRLHEPAWRKLAERLHLTYKPFGGGANPAACVEGLYGGREIRLTTRRSRNRRRRGPMMEDFLSLAVPVELPSGVRLEIRHKPRAKRDPRLEGHSSTGNTAFDRRLVLFARPPSLADSLSASGLLEDLAQVTQARRQTTITLNNGNLRFEEKSNLYNGAESRLGRLEQLISVMVRLADVLSGSDTSGPDNLFDAETVSAELNAAPPVEAAPAIPPRPPEAAKNAHTRLIGALTTIVAGLVGGVSGLIVWFPAYIITLPFGQPTFIGGIVLFLITGVVGGVFGGVAGTLVCAKVGKSRYGKVFDWKGAVWFGLGGIIIGGLCAFIGAAIPGFFISPNSQ
ncbi:MAG: hypothetical protein D6796_04480 [Caldilineae bacterium]|nr:MAG: hypothetical protein D6796_04480 [Caldilineae bacterium]